MQDAFIKLWEHRAALDPEQSVRAYLYTIVRNTALNRIAQQKRRREHLQDLASPAPAADTADALDARELQTHIRAWIDELPPRRREAFRLSRRCSRNDCR